MPVAANFRSPRRAAPGGASCAASLQRRLERRLHLNISSGGLMIYSKAAAHPGTTVEVRRGGQMVVARVVWRQNHRIGLKSQSPLEVDELISDATAAAAVPAIAGGFRVERRTRPRHSDRSRHVARAVEFLSVVVIGIVLAAFSATTVYETIAKPVSAVQRVLDAH